MKEIADNWETECLRLTQDYLSGQIDEEGFKQLEEMLKSSSEARSQFRRYTRTDVALREISESVDSEAPALVGFDTGRTRKNTTVWLWLQAAAIVVLAAVIAVLVVDRKQAVLIKVDPTDGSRTGDKRPTLIQGQDFSDGAMAVLTHAVGVEWEGDLAYAEGAALRPDTLKISQGLLQIEFFSGATVVVEGPAEFELIDPMKARCSLGRVRANVPHFARGFSVMSSDLQVVDLGTEFGFSASEDGSQELHVFDGEVTVQGGVVGNNPRHLMGGTAVRMHEDGMRFFDAADEEFADSQQIASLASAAADEQRQQWLRYSEELKANGDVLLYYSFDNQMAWSRRLSNDKKMVPDPLYGAIVGCRWAEGRWNGKAALEFKRSSDRVRISIPEKLNEVTLMAWVRIDGFDRKLNSLMLSDGWEPGGLHWQFTQEGALILGLRGEDGTPSASYTSNSVLGQQHLGQWLHLAVSYGGEGGEVVHYLNGRPIGRQQVKDHHEIEVPRGQLGNWSAGHWPPKTETDIRNLNGRMDEFLVFSAALPPSGVRDIFREGRPR